MIFSCSATSGSNCGISTALLPCSCLRKPRQIRDVLRPPAVEEQIVLAVDRGPQCFWPAQIRDWTERDAVFPLGGLGRRHARPVDLQLILSGQESMDRRTVSADRFSSPSVPNSAAMAEAGDDRSTSNLQSAVEFYSFETLFCTFLGDDLAVWSSGRRETRPRDRDRVVRRAMHAMPVAASSGGCHWS